jgi:hypothetical protein
MLLMATKLSRLAIACCLPLPHELSHAARAAIAAARRRVPGLSGPNRSLEISLDLS